MIEREPPIADINAKLASSTTIGAFIVNKRSTGTSVQSVRILGDIEFFGAYVENSWEGYKSGAMTFSTLEEMKSKAVPERAQKTFLSLTAIKSCENQSGFTGLDRTIYLRLGEVTPHHYIHEALHVYSHRDFKTTFGKDIEKALRRS